jgi:hypothetical protein
MKMFSDGDVAVPELEMEESKQLITMLPNDSVFCNKKSNNNRWNYGTTADG